MPYGRSYISIVMFLLVSFLVYGAPKKEIPPESRDAERAQQLFTDSVGRRVALPKTITRIVPSGALAQMFLLAIAPDKVCAISSPYDRAQAAFIPSAFTELPVVGQFYGAANLNPEEIARIGPDVVIDIGEPKDAIAQDMDAITASIGIPTIHITATLQSTPGAFRTLGTLLDRETQGEALARFCEKTLAAAEAIARQAGNTKKSVLYCLGSSGLNVLAQGTFHTEVLDWMADNRATVDNPSSRGSGNETNLEQILLWDPEVILFGPGSIYASAAQDPTWRELKAIQQGTYYEVPWGPYNWMGSPPAINRYLGMLWLGAILYPEYAAYDLYEETAEYYRLFYGYELSPERFKALTRTALPGPR